MTDGYVDVFTKSGGSYKRLRVNHQGHREEEESTGRICMLFSG